MCSTASTSAKVIAITGPTAVGKSAVAFRVCEAIGGEIVSCDSVQVFRDLNIGANKPSTEERARIPHHLVDIADLDTSFSAGQYVHMARKAIQDVLSRGKVPVVVGGSMMYMAWLAQGPPDNPAADPQCRKEADAMVAPYKAEDDWAGALQLLADRNPGRAAQLTVNDWYRLERALEVVLTSPPDKEVYTGLRAPPGAEGGEGVEYDVRGVFVAGPREEVCRRIDARCEDMLREGLLREVAGLLAGGRLKADSMPGRAIGYRQTLEYLTQEQTNTGREGLMEFVDQFCAKTRQYAGSQQKWFRGPRGADFLWLEWDLSTQESLRHLQDRIQEAYRVDVDAYREMLRSQEQEEVRLRNSQAAPKMKTYQKQLTWLNSADAVSELLQEAEECKRQIQEAMHAGT